MKLPADHYYCRREVDKEIAHVGSLKDQLTLCGVKCYQFHIEPRPIDEATVCPKCAEKCKEVRKWG